MRVGKAASVWPRKSRETVGLEVEDHEAIDVDSGDEEVP